MNSVLCLVSVGHPSGHVGEVVKYMGLKLKDRASLIILRMGKDHLR